MSDNKKEKNPDFSNSYYEFSAAICTSYIVLIILNLILFAVTKSPFFNYLLSIVTLTFLLYKNINHIYPDLTYDNIRTRNLTYSLQLPALYLHYSLLRASYRPFAFYSFVILIVIIGLSLFFSLGNLDVFLDLLFFPLVIFISIFQILLVMHLAAKIKLITLGISFDELKTLVKKPLPTSALNPTQSNLPQDLPSTHDIPNQDQNPHQERPVWQAKPQISVTKTQITPQDAIYVRQLQAYQTAL